MMSLLERKAEARLWRACNPQWMFGFHPDGSRRLLKNWLLRITQVLARECLGNRGREAVWRPAASCAPRAVARVRKGSRVDQAVAAEMERSGQT